MFQKFKIVWDEIQSLLDIRGDVVMLIMSAVFIVRIAMVLKGCKPLNASESALYASAIGSFAWSNK